MARTSFTSFIRGLGAPLLWRVFAFLFIFIIVSGLLGPRLIGSGLLYRYHFDVYGGAGKTLLFGIVVFGLLARRRSLIELDAWKRTDAIWLFAAATCFIISYISVHRLIVTGGTIGWAVLVHMTMLLCLVLALFGCFGLGNLRWILREYRRELLVSIGLALGFYVFLLAVYGLWQELSAVVLQAVAYLLRLSGLMVVILPPRTLLLEKFGVEVAQYCSGIESIALFTGLYAIIGILDWPKLKHKAFLVVFPIALLLLFGFNILRVFGLILAGYYINQNIAFSLFHTYAGMVFFLLYSGIFWSIAYMRLLKQQSVTILSP